MINLLSEQDKLMIAAAKRNVTLRKYVISLLFVTILVTICFAIGYFILEMDARRSAEISARYLPQKEAYSTEIKQSKQFTDNLKTAQTILGGELKFSVVMAQIAKTLPPGTALEKLDLSLEKLQKPIELTIKAKSYNDAIATKNAFASSEFFTGSDLKSIDLRSEGDYDYSFILITSCVKNKLINLGEQSL